MAISPPGSGDLGGVEADEGVGLGKTGNPGVAEAGRPVPVAIAPYEEAGAAEPGIWTFGGAGPGGSFWQTPGGTDGSGLRFSDT